MKVPSITADSEVLLNTYGIYHLAQLKAKEETKKLVKDFEDAQNKLEAKYLERKEENKKLLLNQAQEMWARLDLYHNIRQLYRDILNIVQGNRKHRMFEKYFPKGLKPFSNVNSFQISSSEEILIHLGSESDGDLKKEFYTLIQESFKKAKKESADVEKIEKKISEIFTLEKQAREDWKAVYQKDYLEILLVFHNNKEIAEIFFKSAAKKKKKSGEEGEEKSGDEKKADGK